MKRPQLCAALLGAAIALAAGGSSHASVTYAFQAFFEAPFALPDGYLTYVSPDFITTDRIVPTDALGSCVLPPFGPDLCERPAFLHSPAGDVLGFGVFRPPPGPILPYFFRVGAFGHAGVYEALSYSPTAARLTVTETGVPEPAPWAMMILGFGGVGAAVRRRGRRGSMAAIRPCAEASRGG